MGKKYVVNEKVNKTEEQPLKKNTNLPLSPPLPFVFCEDTSTLGGSPLCARTLCPGQRVSGVRGEVGDRTLGW